VRSARLNEVKNANFFIMSLKTMYKKVFADDLHIPDINVFNSIIGIFYE